MPDATPPITPASLDAPGKKSAPSNLRQRVIYASIGAALLLGSVWFSVWSFALFFAAVQVKMLLEFYRMMRAGGTKPAKWIGVGAGLLIFGVLHLFIVCYPDYAIMFGWPLGWTIFPPLSVLPQAVPDTMQIGPQLLTASLNAIVWLVAAGILLVGLLLREIALWPNHGQPFANVGATLSGLLYISLPMAFLSIVASTDEGYDYRRIFGLLFLIWASDIGAYAAGKTFGKHKLAPSISPGKTWEGWAGGFLLTLAVGWGLKFMMPDVPLAHLLVAAGVVAVFGPLGDLAESMLKRSVGVKDSGTFMPGHGGLLDRFDAFLLVLPVLALLQLLFS
ncbi:phosphatidate cytidylyltransferase [Hymenobacter lapidarius]|uniref:phosphatidate cytidylyltransferase n=1 Tax=Hymenobacter lapidarius TaxID=1908237 RepID=UPI000A8BFC1D|nr:phosphatidate cytidylyltransferase [Hymenobacter lapidarius]